MSQFEKEYQTVSDVIENLSQFEKRCIDSGDLRGVFTTAYLEITKAISNRIDSTSFKNPGWVTAYLIRFGNLYREALFFSDTANYERVPKSWKIAFETAKTGDGLIIQHLLLGINAHINHDLAIALCDVKIDPVRSDKHHDHTEVNNILRETTENLKSEVTIKYAPILKRLDRKTGYISNDAANFSIPKAREHAWSFAIALTRTKGNAEQTLLRKALDDQAAVMARLIMASPTRDRRFVQSVSFMKRVDGFVTRIKIFFRR